ncbi:54S ribosomal protein img2, mitochondrial [Coniothyrium glycines]
MPRTQSFAPLLRPLIAPRPVACPQHFRFSTTSRRFAHPSSQTPSLPPNTATQTPPKPQDAARAADLAATEAVTESDSAQPVQPKPALPSERPKGSVKPLTDSLTPFTETSAHASSPQNTPKPQRTLKLELPPPRYHVGRSSSKNLPIYTDYKRGGNLHLTTIRKITGDPSALRDELRVLLNKKEGDVKVNTLNNHVIIKGHHTVEVSDFLKARGM